MNNLLSKLVAYTGQSIAHVQYRLPIILHGCCRLSGITLIESGSSMLGQKVKNRQLFLAVAAHLTSRSQARLALSRFQLPTHLSITLRLLLRVTSAPALLENMLKFDQICKRWFYRKLDVSIEWAAYFASSMLKQRCVLIRLCIAAEMMSRTLLKAFCCVLIAGLLMPVVCLCCSNMQA